MSTLKRIQFTAVIHAPVPVVWHHVTSLESYQRWASAFAEGSTFQGAWEQGSKIWFLAPSGDGMVAEIADRQENALISIRHLGFVVNGAEDTTSEAVLAWAPAGETYSFFSLPEGTRMVVDQEVATEWEDHLNEAWPKALALL